MTCMKNTKLGWLVFLILQACAMGAFAQVAVPSTYKQITVDGSFGDWAGVPLGYTQPAGSPNAIQYKNIYIANDTNNLYIRFTLYVPRVAFEDSYDNIFIDADDDVSTGFVVGGIGSEMLIQWGGGYQEKNGGFNEGNIDNLGWNIAGSPDNTDFELSISLGATYDSDGTQVLGSSTIAILLEGDSTNYVNTEFAPSSGGLVYTFAAPPAAVTANETLIGLATTSWQFDDAGTDLGTNWLAANFDYSTWTSGDGLFGFTPTPGLYPPIQTPLSTSPNTDYLETQFPWTNNPANTAFVVSNYLSDGAVYYLNGVEIRRIRMPAGTISYATPATAANPAPGQPEIFGIDGSELINGTNTLQVETHQAGGSSADMVFGLSLTAAIDYPVLVVNTNLPADQSVTAGNSVTFMSETLGSGPLYYQWFFNGTNVIAGANSASYTIPLVLTNNAGTYSLQVSNSSSSVTTRAAQLSVTSIPVSITSDPVPAVVVEGTPATFSVGVSGTPLISYQWLLNSQPIAGATNSTFTIPSAAPTNAGAYSVAVGNPAGTTNSSAAQLTVLADTVPPTIAAATGGYTSVVVTFSKPVDPTTASVAGNYSISGGINVLSATPNSGNTSQVTLTTGAPMAFGTAYTLTVAGVQDFYGNVAHASGQFSRSIIIDGSFDDWTGVAPIYTSTSPSGNTDAADFQAIYVYNDANFYYFRVTLWTDIDPSAGEFPAYVNMMFDTDNNAGTGYGAIGSELLIQSGIGYQEKDGGFNDGFPIIGLDWLCLPASPGTNFEFEFSRAAMFSEDNTPVFSTDQINFLFQGQTPSYTLENSTTEVSYTNEPSVALEPLPVSNLGMSSVAGSQAAVFWNGAATLQESSSVSGPWTNVPAATSPFVLSSAGGGSQFFRLTR